MSSGGGDGCDGGRGSGCGVGGESGCGSGEGAREEATAGEDQI